MLKTERSVDRIVEQHTELRGRIATIREFLDRPRPAIGTPGYHTWAAELSEMLLQLHDKLFRHFREEDRSGFLDELETKHPRATHVIEALRRDHDRLLGDLRAILSAVLSYGEGKAPEDTRLRRWTERLLDGLAEHEREETDLLQRLLYEDLGTGD